MTRKEVCKSYYPAHDHACSANVPCCVPGQLPGHSSWTGAACTPSPSSPGRSCAVPKALGRAVGPGLRRKPPQGSRRDPLVETGGVIKPKAAKGDLTLSSGGDTAAIKTKDATAAARVDAPGKLPKPNLKGSTATYPSTYGKDIDLVVTATPTGFRQQIVIRERLAGPVTFRIPVDLPQGALDR
ncbi:hypothetical protein [Nonomuraea insulae]|uniref:Uncharacterized protein n=1 Tax=Nonomuraea insulae TaxID=1616787 RepID=A0ABW1CZD8_9ACTN